MIHKKKWLMVDPNQGYGFGVLAGPSLGDQEELHGPYDSEEEAETVAREIMAEYSAIQYVRLVKIETPHVRTIAERAPVVA